MSEQEQLIVSYHTQSTICYILSCRAIMTLIKSHSTQYMNEQYAYNDKRKQYLFKKILWLISSEYWWWFKRRWNWWWYHQYRTNPRERGDVYTLLSTSYKHWLEFDLLSEWCAINNIDYHKWMSFHVLRYWIDIFIWRSHSAYIH